MEAHASYWGRAITILRFRGVTDLRQAAEQCSAAFVLESNDLVQSGVARHLAVRKNIDDTLSYLRMRRFFLGHDV